jgi:Domain of unknown function (DUF4391)
MSAAAVIAALGLPSEARLDRRVPKKLLVEQGAPTAADRRQIQDGVEELVWVAALKPGNIGVPEFRDELREYLEIAVLAADLRAAARAARLTELIHRAIPYPVLLVTNNGETQHVSLAHKRFSQNEGGSTVLDWGVIASPSFSSDPTIGADEIARSFLESLSLAAQNRVHLCALYQGWVDCVWAFQAGRITGRFVIAATEEAAAERRAAVAEYARIRKEITNLRARAEDEKQMNRRVELNLEIRRLDGELARTKTRI